MKRLMARRSASVARRAGSQCRMEALEPRLLLANELIIGIGDVLYKDPQLPGDKIEIPVTFQNVSATQISGKVRIRIYASGDGVVDPDDFLLVDKQLNINPRPNEIQTRKVKGQFPLDTLPDSYQLVVMVDEGESMLPPGVTFIDPEVSDLDGVGDPVLFDLRWVFGDVNGRNGNTTLRFMNSSGVVYSIRYENIDFDSNDEGEVFVDLPTARNDIPDQSLILELENSNDEDRVTVRRVGGPKDPALFYLNGIFTDLDLRGGSDPLGFFDAPDLTLYGPAEFHRGLNKLNLGNIMNAGYVAINTDLDLSLGASEDSRGSTADEFQRVSIKVREVVGTRFVINQTLANMKAISFSGFIDENGETRGDRELGGIDANLIDKVNIRDHFEGVVFAGLPALRGELFPVGDNAVNDFVVGGALTGAFLTYGDVGKIQAGSIGEFEAAIHGRLERLVVKGDVGQANHPDPLRGAPFHTIIGARDISRIDIAGDVTESAIFAGLDYVPFVRGIGFFGIYDGDISSAEFTSGIIGRINVGGDVIFSEFAAGVNPDGALFFVFGFLVGDSSVSRIGPIKVGGVASGYKGSATFISGDFPDSISIDGSSYSTITNPDGTVLVVFPLI